MVNRRRHFILSKISALIKLFVLINITHFSGALYGQNSFNSKDEMSNYPDTIHKKRLITVGSTVGTAYVLSAIGLYNTWYSQYPRSGFHFFNDWNEWNNMDKYGHIFTAYFQGITGYKLARWCGIQKNEAILIGAIGGSLFQTTIEVMDGFSEEWGFSIPDMGANILGTGIFVLQQQYWEEQRIQLKFASWPTSYPNDVITGNDGSHQSLNSRAQNLFGTHPLERFLKDYNGQSYWLSFNIKDFFPNSNVPKWLNLAMGYSAGNMYGGFENRWENQKAQFDVADDFPRFHQFLLGLDLNLTGIKTKSSFIGTLLNLMNAYKLPLPTIEYNTLGEVRFHLVFKN